jgi:hypothetical protein
MDKYLEYLKKQFTERQTSLADALAEGAAKSYEEYKQLVGEIRGLSFAQLCVSDLVRKLENDDDET